MNEEINRWTAKRKMALILEIIEGRGTVFDVSLAYNQPPSNINGCIEDGRKGMKSALKATPRTYESGTSAITRSSGEQINACCPPLA